MFEDLKKNILQERKIIGDLNSIEAHLVSLEGGGDREFYINSKNSLLHQLRMLNRAIPDLMRMSPPLNGGVKGKEKSDVVKMSYISPSTKEKSVIAIDKKDKKNYLEKLRISERGMVGMKKEIVKNKNEIVTKANYLARVSNRVFRKTSEKLAPRFSSLSEDLKKANIHFLMSSYISIALFMSMLVFGLGLLVFIVMVIFSLSNLIYIWIPFAACALALMGFYFYPSSEASSVQKKITQELPFATIHMAAIAGSNIEPTKIFKIIAMSREYPNIGKEMRKVINQTDIYGYDLVTSLKNVSKRTSNKKLSELFSGLATNITSGGELKNYLEKKSDNYLLDYRLERTNYSELAGTFMDVYISILIAAPLVLMMMFIVMNVAGLGLAGLSIEFLLGASIAVVAVINVIFLVILNWKQPKV